MAIEQVQGDPAIGVPTQSLPVKLSALEEYVATKSNNNGFEAEFKSVPMGTTAATEAADLPENKDKNRYPDLRAYDHNRVTLVDVDPGRTDYYNASWMDGHYQPQRYICCQAPLPDTIEDFWHMVWQVEAKMIVILTVLEEHGKVKCEKYWTNGVHQYGRVQVKLSSECKASEDYIIRKFVLEKGGERRELTQYHFVGWPDMGVPSTESFIEFLAEIRGSPAYASKRNPIVIHCSAGVGRTGTFLVTDTMMEMSKARDYVDFLKCLCKARSMRNDIVEKLSQYTFAHEIVVKCLGSKESWIKDRIGHVRGQIGHGIKDVKGMLRM